MPEKFFSLSITWTSIMHLHAEKKIQTLKRSLESKFRSRANSFTNTLFKERLLVTGAQQNAGMDSELRGVITG
jgi:hypothetical protein